MESARDLFPVVSYLVPTCVDQATTMAACVLQRAIAAENLEGESSDVIARTGLDVNKAREDVRTNAPWTDADYSDEGVPSYNAAEMLRAAVWWVRFSLTEVKSRWSTSYGVVDADALECTLRRLMVGQEGAECMITGRQLHIYRDWDDVDFEGYKNAYVRYPMGVHYLIVLNQKIIKKSPVPTVVVLVRAPQYVAYMCVFDKGHGVEVIEEAMTHAFEKLEKDKVRVERVKHTAPESQNAADAVFAFAIALRMSYLIAERSFENAMEETAILLQAIAEQKRTFSEKCHAISALHLVHFVQSDKDRFKFLTEKYRSEIAEAAKRDASTPVPVVSVAKADVPAPAAEAKVTEALHGDVVPLVSLPPLVPKAPAKPAPAAPLAASAAPEATGTSAFAQALAQMEARGAAAPTAEPRADVSSVASASPPARGATWGAKMTQLKDRVGMRTLMYSAVALCALGVVLHAAGRATGERKHSKLE